MARKATYLYRVRMKRNDGFGQVDYCYARNAAHAVEGMKSVHAESRFTRFEPVCFAEADIEKHPEYFSVLTEEERSIIIKNRLASADKYSIRREAASFDMDRGTFISAEEMETLMQ